MMDGPHYTWLLKKVVIKRISKNAQAVKTITSLSEITMTYFFQYIFIWCIVN